MKVLKEALMFSLPEHIKKVHVYEPGKPEEELKRELGLREIVKLASN